MPTTCRESGRNIYTLATPVNTFGAEPRQKCCRSMGTAGRTGSKPQAATLQREPPAARRLPIRLFRCLLGRPTPAALLEPRALGRDRPGKRSLGVGFRLLLGDQLVALGRHLAQAPQHAAGSGRN